MPAAPLQKTILKILDPVLSGMAVVRQKLTEAKIRREAQAFASRSPLPIGETTTLEILPLYEASAPDGLERGMGVSYLIRTDSASILFDLGNNPSAGSPSPLERNMDRLGISLKGIDMIVISHRHPDHIGGMKWWKRRSFSLNGVSQPPLGTMPVYVSEKISYPGSRLTLVPEPAVLVKGVATTGRFTFFEPYHVWWMTPRDNEQALAVNVAGRGMVVITGCGHMGLKTLVERVESLYGVPVIGVLGGLHYMKANDDEMQPDIEFLRGRKPGIVALSSHDSGPAALDAFARAFPGVCRSIRVGEAITIA